MPERFPTARRSALASALASSLLGKHQLGWKRHRSPRRVSASSPAASQPRAELWGDPLGLPPRDAEDGAAYKQLSLRTSFSTSCKGLRWTPALRDVVSPAPGDSVCFP